MKITVIGETNLDIVVERLGDEHQGGCTPAHIRMHHGGVARNIAHNLSLLGQKVRLMTVFGGDDFASQLIEDCKNIGMDLSLSTRFKHEKSPIFLCFNDKSGNMQSAVSDIGLNNRMDLEWLKSKMDEINLSDFVVANTLITAEALAHLIDCSEVPLFIDTVSPKRAMVLAEALSLSKKKSFSVLKCNLSEACAMSGESEAKTAAKKLVSNGIQEVFVTMGADGVVYASGTETIHVPAVPAQVVNVMGAGDAFIAGIVYAKALGFNGIKSIPFGLQAAKTALESASPCSEEITQLMQLGDN